MRKDKTRRQDDVRQEDKTTSKKTRRRQVLILDKVIVPGFPATMSRPLRVEYAGGCYHVINRGNYRQMIFKKKGAAEAFERTLSEAAEKFGWRVHAYVVMGNHFHLGRQDDVRS